MAAFLIGNNPGGPVPGMHERFSRRVRPVGRRALRFIASHKFSAPTPSIDPEGLCPHRPGMQGNFIEHLSGEIQCY